MVLLGHELVYELELELELEPRTSWWGIIHISLHRSEHIARARMIGPRVKLFIITVANVPLPKCF